MLKVDPSTKAVICGDDQLTFGELEARAARFVNGLKKRGLKVGDCVAMLLPNSIEFAEIAYACEKAGFWFAAINRSLKGAEVAYIVQDSQSVAFFAHESLAEAAIIAASVPALKIRAAIGEIPGFESYENLILEATSDPIVPTVTAGGRMYYTSGTTGRPKGVRRLRANAEDERIRQKRWAPLISGKSVNLCPGPLYHAAPLRFDLITPLFLGVTAVIMERFDPEAFLGMIQKHQVTHSHMVATMFRRLLALPYKVRASYDISSMEQILHGAAPTAVPIKRAMIDWFGPILHEYYGGSEGGGTDIKSAEWLAKPGSVGKAFYKRKVVILDDDDNEQLPEKVGRVFFDYLGEPTFQYHNDFEKTLKAFSGRRFTLGDYGYLDHDHFLFLTGRSSEIIIAGGVNIYPVEVDAILQNHKMVLDSATIGIPSKEYGEEVKSVVLLQKGARAHENLKKELIDYCLQRLSKYKCPRSVDFVDSLPRSEAGKIQRTLVRKSYWANETSQV
jgi:long-chain acyl-CoA synthetase